MLKRGNKIILVSCLAFALLFFSCGNKEGKGDDSIKLEIEPVENDMTHQALSFADTLLVSMTLEERVGQCLMPSIFSLDDSSTLNLLKQYIDDYHVGGVVLMKGNLASAAAIAKIGESAKIPLFISIDAEWGLGMRLVDAPVYPKNGDLGDKVEESELFDYGRKIAEECKNIGINMVLGPVVDLSNSWKGIIAKRSYGNNPTLVANYGVAYAKGLESGGVISVAKHFPGHGSTLLDSHKRLVKITRDISQMDSLDLRPFREYINSGLNGVMAGHISALSLDPDGNPASVSMDMLTSLLREEMGFNGLILTDAFNMGGAKGFSAAEALKAGADLVLCPSDLSKEYNELLSEVRNGELNVEIINNRCRRILFIKYLFHICS